MKGKWKKKTAFLITLAMVLQLTACAKAPAPSAKETAPGSPEAAASEAASPEVDADILPAVGEELSGFTLQEAAPYSPLNAELLMFTHEKSGAQLCYIKNDDTNRAFSITYRTPQVDETDANHIFEHAIIASSEKYPSKDLFFDLAGKTYNTYVNAYTCLPFTIYPVASQSEEQLLLMADAYLSCMISPDLLHDEHIFRREALRYMLYDVDEPISMGGTVFSEDTGYMTDIGAEAARNLLQALYPGEYAANYIGRAHINYRDLTYEHMAETFERYYSFDNSLLLLYGDLDYRRFLKFLDEEYLSKAEKRGADLSAYDDPASAPGYVEKTVYAPAYEGDSTEDASCIFYGMDLDGLDWETLAQYDLFSSMLNSDSSPLHENLRAAGLTAPVLAELTLDSEKPLFSFEMEYADPEDAAALKAAVDSTLSDIAENGLDEELLETVLKTKRLDDYTSMEYTDVVIEEIFPLICTKWAQAGETDILLDGEDAFSAMQQDTQQALICELAGTLKNASRSAMVTTIPKPGLAEQILAEQEAYLAEMKASMTPKELEQMVKDTLAFDEWNASEQSNSDIVIPVEDLPEPEPAAKFTKETVDGAVYYAAASDMEKISLHRIQFDTSAVPEEDLHYIHLYSILLEELAAGDYSKAKKDDLMAQYLYQFNVSNIYPETGENQYPMLSMEWYCLAEDYEASLRLLLEIMGGLKLDDRDELIRVLDKRLPSLDHSKEDPFSLSEALALTGVSRSHRYYDYLAGQRFYEFVSGLRTQLDEDPGAMETIAAKLDSIQKLILHKDRMSVMNVAPKDELEQISVISRKVLEGLPSLPSVEADYELPEYPDRTAVIVEASSSSTFSISGTSLIDGFPGSFYPLAMALSDRYIVPRIRFQGLAYSAAMGHYRALDYIYTYADSDPDIANTLSVIDGEAEALAAMELTQEELDSYILYSYAFVTYPSGNLNKYMEAMDRDLSGFDVENLQRLAAEIKTASVDDKEQAVEKMRKLLKNQHLVTVGNAELIRSEEDLFDQIYDYRKPLNQ